MSPRPRTFVFALLALLVAVFAVMMLLVLTGIIAEPETLIESVFRGILGR
jgi:hypothetical protein